MLDSLTSQLKCFILISLGILIPLVPITSLASEHATTTSQLFELKSSITHKNYRITTYRSTQDTPKQGYRVIYLLDGHQTFPLAQRLVEQWSNKAHLQPILLVGIDYVDQANWLTYRAQDYTPSHNAQKPTDPFLQGEANGGDADKFLAVLTNEIKPLIETHYSVNKTQQVLFGHSYGGLFTLHVFLTAPQSFQFYYASSPSIWWDNKVILQELEQNKSLIAKQLIPTIMISVGNLEQYPKKPISEDRKEKLKVRQQVSNAQDLFKRLVQLHPNTDQIQLHIFLDKDHGAVIQSALEQLLNQFIH